MKDADTTREMLAARIAFTKGIFASRGNSEDFRQIFKMLSEFGLSEKEAGFFAGMSYAIDGFPGVPPEHRDRMFPKKEEANVRPD